MEKPDFTEGLASRKDRIRFKAKTGFTAELPRDEATTILYIQ